MAIPEGLRGHVSNVFDQLGTEYIVPSRFRIPYFVVIHMDRTDGNINISFDSCVIVVLEIFLLAKY